METTSVIENMAAAFKMGGPWMVAIAIALTVSIAFSIERFIRLYYRYNIDGPSFMFEIQKYVVANDIDGAIRLCNGAENTALARVMKAGLQRASRSESQIQ